MLEPTKKLKTFVEGLNNNKNMFNFKGVDIRYFNKFVLYEKNSKNIPKDE
jgi:hypothetical protein